MLKPRWIVRRTKVDDCVHYNRDVRDDLRQGDVLLFRGDRRLSRVIEAVGRGHYSHSALVLRWDGRVMIAQAEWPRLEAVPMSVAVEAYSGLVDWFRVKPEFEPQLDRAKLLDEAMNLLGKPFSVRELVRIGIYNLLRKQVPKSADDGGFVCSEYVSHCFRQAGLTLAPDRPHDVAVTPDDLEAGGRLAHLGTIHWDENERPATMARVERHEAEARTRARPPRAARD